MIFTFKIFTCKFFILLTNRSEDMFIDLYLSGYKNIEVSEPNAVTVPFETNDFFKI